MIAYHFNRDCLKNKKDKVLTQKGYKKHINIITNDFKMTLPGSEKSNKLIAAGYIIKLGKY